MQGPRIVDHDKTITGFIFDHSFIYGAFHILLAVACACGCFLIFNSSDPLFLRLVGCLFCLLAVVYCVWFGAGRIRKAWKDWRRYVKENYET